ncbi:MULTISPECIES: winged helix-turn-helix domain-containing protein [unclassified Streptomyces]|uniref:ArsR/SmtB family transcription factor n=1 Tax=unclassified Streptomyces TaxID=2593676 RepID=UPI00035E0351|nr:MULTISPECIES: winged helix-turn-helix domain-containing protein [unclassified Streptomyces]MYX37066.1 ArsR family transcriptional regulator [Streptomyces sp. SID8377]
MMRLEFTAADLRNLTVTAPRALEETALSIRRLRIGPVGVQRIRPGLAQWHRRHRTRAAAQAGILLDLVPREGFLPDFLLPLADDLTTGVDLAAQTPAEQLAADIEQLPAAVRTQRRLRDLAEGTSHARQGLARDLRRYFDSCLVDVWPQIQAHAAADRALRAETLLRGGIDGLLATLGDRWRWEPPFLHIPWSGLTDVEVPLCGRGLILVPSYFGGPALMYRPEDPTVLIYPMHAGEAATRSADTLGPLLGRTRAAVLAAVRQPANTTTIAERACVSLPSASQHATVLRNAGLLTTTRTGSAVLHALSPLGEALLRGDSAAY